MLNTMICRLLSFFALSWLIALPGVTCARTMSDLYQAAKGEGVVTVYAATDRNVTQPLVLAFEKRYPGVRVEIEDLSTSELYQRFLDDAGTGHEPDVLWSSAMDLQVKLVNDGYAQPYRSPETMALPKWAVWKDEAFGTTFEPVAFVYNRKMLQPEEVPSTHAELLRLLTRERGRFAGRLTGYDPGASGLGLLLHSQDVLANPVVFWKLAQSFGRTGIVTLPSSGAMLDRISSGELLFGYNVLGSYARLRAAHDPAIGVMLPRDYTLVMSRVAFIARRAKHPNAARLWLDYLLSVDGQRLIASQPGFFSVRDDVRDVAATLLQKELGGAFRPIAIGTGLMTYIDQAKRHEFLRQWNETLLPLP